MGELADWIVLARNTQTPITRGLSFLVTRIEIRSRRYIPDVYARFALDVLPYQLYDDEVVIGHVMEQLHRIGYAGRPFHRAELGMQGLTFIVLEPNREFRQFVVERQAWQDMAFEPGWAR